MVAENDYLWTPSAAIVRDANITQYQTWLKNSYDVDLKSYADLQAWSVSRIDDFWRSIWEYFEIDPDQLPSDVLADRSMPGARWFPETKVNYAKYLLSCGRDTDVAIVHIAENGAAVTLTWAELRDNVERVASFLQSQGIKPGDRVVGYLSTRPEAVIAMLATIGCGAIWSCCSPDFGPTGVLDRIRQIRPKMIFAVEGYDFGGEFQGRREALFEIIEGLTDLTKLIIVPTRIDKEFKYPVDDVMDWPEVLATGALPLAEFPALPFDHPIWVVYTSGTSGLPKAVVHGHGGVLVEQLKCNAFHFDIKPHSTSLYFTTVGWIIFNNLVSTLLMGAKIILYDGNPVWPDGYRLWQIAEEYGVTHFGTRPAFVTLMQHQAIHPGERFDLGALVTVISTGAPLETEGYRWLHKKVRSDIWVNSICGSTDLVSGILGGVATLPVFAGELQARCLAVDVEAFDDTGNAIIDSEGELVIRQPMPSMPVGLWADDNDERYRRSYFDKYPGIWRQGDLLTMTKRGAGVVSGRSDATLNRGGVRIGTSEIYRVVERIAGIADSLIVHVEKSEGSSWMPLFVVTSDQRDFDEELCKDIIHNLRTTYSPRYVPDEIIQTDAVPYTLTGKKMEVPVKRILGGASAKDVVNMNTMLNPLSIQFYVDISAQRASSRSIPN